MSARADGQREPDWPVATTHHWPHPIRYCSASFSLSFCSNRRNQPSTTTVIARSMAGTSHATWQSPLSILRSLRITGDSHVGALPLLGMTSLVVRQKRMININLTSPTEKGPHPNGCGPRFIGNYSVPIPDQVFSSPPSGGVTSPPSPPSGGVTSPPSPPSGGVTSPPSPPSGGVTSPPSPPSGGVTSPPSGGT